VLNNNRMIFRREHREIKRSWLHRFHFAAAVLLVTALSVLASCSSNKNKPGVQNPTPVIAELFPDTVTALELGPVACVNAMATPTSKFLMLNITSQLSQSSVITFVSASQVLFNGQPVQKVMFDDVTGQLTAPLTACDIDQPTTASITVMNPPNNAGLGGGTSSAASFFIVAPNNQPPAITSVSPAAAVAGGSGFSLLLQGSNFLITSGVSWNGSPRTTIFNPASSSLTAFILSQDIATAGTANIVVTNPAPAGGVSPALTYTINSSSGSTPAILTTSPSAVLAGGSAFSLIVSGNNLNAASTVSWNGSARTTTFDPTTGELTASILNTDIASAGSGMVTVSNAGGTSTPFVVPISAPADQTTPTIVALSPQFVSAGSAGLTLVVSGSNFSAALQSTVAWNGASRSTTFNASTGQLSINLTSADLASAGTAIVTVTNEVTGNSGSAPVTSKDFVFLITP
jgi:hypothetical protein